MAYIFIPAAIRQEAAAACLANNAGVELLLMGRNSESLFHFAVASEKLLKVVVSNDIHGLSIQEEILITQQEKHICIFSLIKTQDQGEVILMLTHVPSKNIADEEDTVFLSSGMSHEWLLAMTLIAIHNAVSACEILKEYEQATSLVETAWELINAQYWSWEDVLVGKVLPGGQSQTIKFLLVLIIYNRGRLFLEMFSKKILQVQDTMDTADSSLMAEELNNLLKEAVNSFSLVAASKQDKQKLLILQEQQPEGCRRFQEINMFLLAKAWSWMGYAIFLQDATSILVDASYGIARKTYNALCCISGNDRRRSRYCYYPTTVPNVPCDRAAPSA
jgi:hypothetical protein